MGVYDNSQNQVNLGMKKGQGSMLENAVLLKRERRYFSEAARRAIVKEIEEGLSKSEASRKYEVSQTSIHRWFANYSKHYQALLVKVVEHVSDSKRVKQLETELEQAYAMLGRVKAESLLLEAIIEKADEALNTDLKKSFDARRSHHSIAKKRNLK
jgi:transposase-like protein